MTEPRDAAPPGLPRFDGSPGDGRFLVPPREGVDIGDYSVRDFAIKWLIQQADLAEIGRYREANRALDAGDDARRRIVLFGDSLTEAWRDARSLSTSDRRLINRGIAGQNTTQMLLRFEADVVALSPVAVALLGGTNDLRCYVGPPATIADSALERIRHNVAAMADIANARGIAMLIGTLPPIGANPRVHRDHGAIVTVNRWLRDVATERGLTLVDYYAALANAEGRMPSALSEDGVHPNEAGYLAMTTALRGALAGALAAR